MHTPRAVAAADARPLRARAQRRRATSPTSCGSGWRRTTSPPPCSCPSRRRRRFLADAKAEPGPVGRGPARRVLGLVRDGRAPVHQPGHPSPGPALPLREERRERHHLQGLRERRRDASRPTPTGAIEGQRMCRQWSGRQVFAVGRPVLARTTSTPTPRRAPTGASRRSTRAASAGSRSRSASRSSTRRWFRGRETTTSDDVDAARTATAASGRRPRWPRAGTAWPGRRPGRTRTSCRRCRPAASPAWTRPTCTSSSTGTNASSRMGRRRVAPVTLLSGNIAPGPAEQCPRRQELE